MSSNFNTTLSLGPFELAIRGDVLVYRVSEISMQQCQIKGYLGKREGESNLLTLIEVPEVDFMSEERDEHWLLTPEATDVAAAFIAASSPFVKEKDRSSPLSFSMCSF